MTPLGRWLRRTSLDELPQLMNVLCGQMSLVRAAPLALHFEIHRTPVGKDACWSIMASHRADVHGLYALPSQNEGHYGGCRGPRRCLEHLIKASRFHSCRNAAVVWQAVSCGNVVVKACDTITSSGHVPNAQRCVSQNRMMGWRSKRPVPTACLSIVRTLGCEGSRVLTRSAPRVRGAGQTVRSVQTLPCPRWPAPERLSIRGEPGCHSLRADCTRPRSDARTSSGRVGRDQIEG